MKRNDPIASIKKIRGLLLRIEDGFLVALLLATLAAPVAVVPSISRAVTSVQTDIEGVIREIGEFLEEPLEIGEYTFDLSELYGQLSQRLTTFVGDLVQGLLDFVGTMASFALWLIFILIAAFYLVKDADRFTQQLEKGSLQSGERALANR